jgi:hypothetical protein
MPQRQLTPAEWQRVIRTMEDARHLLNAIPREPRHDASILAQIRELDEAERLLGFDRAVDPFPPPNS